MNSGLLRSVVDTPLHDVEWFLASLCPHLSQDRLGGVVDDIMATTDPVHAHGEHLDDLLHRLWQVAWALAPTGLSEADFIDRAILVTLTIFKISAERIESALRSWPLTELRGRATALVARALAELERAVDAESIQRCNVLKEVRARLVGDDPVPTRAPSVPAKCVLRGLPSRRATAASPLSDPKDPLVEFVQNSELRLLEVVAPPGYGKTTRVHAALRWLEDSGWLGLEGVLHHSCTGRQADATVVHRALAGFAERFDVRLVSRARHPSEWAAAFVAALRRRRVLLIFDHTPQAHDSEERLAIEALVKAVIDDLGCQIKCVLLLRRRWLARSPGTAYTNIVPLRPHEVQELFRRQSVGFDSPLEVERLHGWPRGLVLLAAYLKERLDGRTDRLRDILLIQFAEGSPADASRRAARLRAGLMDVLDIRPSQIGPESYCSIDTRSLLFRLDLANDMPLGERIPHDLIEPDTHQRARRDAFFALLTRQDVEWFYCRVEGVMKQMYDRGRLPRLWCQAEERAVALSICEHSDSHWHVWTGLREALRREDLVYHPLDLALSDVHAQAHSCVLLACLCSKRIAEQEFVVTHFSESALCWAPLAVGPCAIDSLAECRPWSEAPLAPLDPAAREVPFAALVGHLLKSVRTPSSAAGHGHSARIAQQSFSEPDR